MNIKDIKKIDRHKVLLYAGIIILAIFLFKECKKKRDKEIVPVKQIVNNIKTDSIASQKYKDSVISIVQYWMRQVSHWEGNWNREVKQNAELQDTLGAWLNSAVPDTCEAYKQKALTQYNKLVLSNRAKDTACNKALKAKDQVIFQKDVLIAQHKKDYLKLKLNTDTCLANQTILERSQPKREFSLGLSGMANYAGELKPAVGLQLGYRNKKGFEVNAAVYTNQVFTIGIKKPLFRF